MSDFAGIGGNFYNSYEMQTPFLCGVRQKGAEKKEKSAMDLLADWKETLYQKIVNGETEETYQIGGTSYTQTEWEKVLAHFDAVSEAMREASRAEFEKREEETKETQAREKAEKTEELMQLSGSAVQFDMLLSDTVQAHFPSAKINEDGTYDEYTYLIAVDCTGIRCCKAGADVYEWKMEFTDENQYEMAQQILAWAGERMDNFRFAANEQFWTDYLGEKLDVSTFQAFLEETENGTAEYTIGDEEQMRIDEEKAQWAKYMNPPGAHFYTAQEMYEQQARKMTENRASLEKLEAVS